jgi:hypothetical protein
MNAIHSQTLLSQGVVRASTDSAAALPKNIATGVFAFRTLLFNPIR